MSAVYLLKFNRDNEIPSQFVCQLAPQEQRYLQRYQRKQDRQQSLLAMLLMKYLLENEFLIHTTIERKDNGQPYVTHPFWEGGISISHSGEWVVCAADPLNNIGVDIEELRPLDNAVAYEMLSLKERDIFNSRKTVQEKQQFLFQQWTVKEAYCKAKGTGLSEKILKELDFLNVERKQLFKPWDFYSTKVSERAFLSICCSVDSEPISYTSITLEQLMSHYTIQQNRLLKV